MSRKKRKTKADIARDEEVRQWIVIVILVALAVIAYMQLGIVGKFLYDLQRFLFGKFFYAVIGMIVAQILITMINRRSGNTSSKNPIAIILIAVGVLLICAMDAPSDLKGFEIVKNYAADIPAYFNAEPIINVGGGIIGAALFSLTSLLIDRTGTVILIAVLFIIAALLLVSLDVYKQAFASIGRFFATDDDEDEDEEEEEEPEENAEDEDEEEQPLQKAQQMSFLKPDGTDKSEMIGRITADQSQGTGTASASGNSAGAIDIRADGQANISDDMVPQNVGSSSSTSDDGEVHANFMTVDDDLLKPQADDNDAEADDTEEIEEDTEEETDEQKTTASPEAERAKRRKAYRLPNRNMLDPIPVKPANSVNEIAAEQKGTRLIEILKNFDIDAQLLETHIGPAVTKFEIRPDANVKVSKISSLVDNIKMELAARDIRIEAPIPGHNAVGVEIPNVEATPVKMKELIAQIPQKDKDQPLLFVLGKDLLGNVITCRLDKMPHLLIAGATGSGKSVCINSIITSLLLRTKPDEVKMLLVDPKKVEFTPYQKIPHLIGPVISDAAQASNALKVIVRIMEERYEVFSQCGVRNITVYNQKVKADPTDDKLKPMPYIVVIIDELADLMSVAGKEVETSIQRITQLARAAGIHLIVATQRPSTDVITGIIKANIPSRIAFAVSSGIDSRTILDHIGAERLLGNGDMLYMPIGENAPIRVQGVYVTDDEVKRVTDFVSSEASPMYDDSFVMLEGVDGNESTGVVTAADDPLYQEIKDYVIDVQKASTSLLQRRFGIGYNRAARMIDALEEKGVIGPAQGSKPRDVYIKKD